VVSLQAARCTPPVVERLREVLSTHPGTTEVQLQLVSGERRTSLRVADGFRVAATPALMGDLKALLGPTCLAG
jgi:DNA polymerase-3 subunit alpha